MGNYTIPFIYIPTPIPPPIYQSFQSVFHLTIPPRVPSFHAHTFLYLPRIFFIKQVTHPPPFFLTYTCPHNRTFHPKPQFPWSIHLTSLPLWLLSATHSLIHRFSLQHSSISLFTLLLNCPTHQPLSFTLFCLATHLSASIVTCVQTFLTN